MFIRRFVLMVDTIAIRKKVYAAIALHRRNRTQASDAMLVVALAFCAIKSFISSLSHILIATLFTRPLKSGTIRSCGTNHS